MNLSFRKLRLDNFKSFLGKHEIDLNGPPGLYFMTGVNELEPELGPNGAGKSTIWDALYWVLFGQTPRGLKAKNIHSWSGSGRTSVSVDVLVDGKIWTITRTWNPNSLTVKDRSGSVTTLEQAEFEKRLGLDPQTASAGLLVDQFAAESRQLFMDRTPNEKLATFARLLDLDIWTTLAERVGDKIVDVENKLTTGQSELGKLKVRSEETAQQIIKERGYSDNFASKQKECIEKIEKDLAELAEKRTELDERWTKTDKLYKQHNQKLRETRAEAEKLTKTQDIAETKISELRSEYDKIATLRGAAESELKKFGKLTDRCPHCKQKVSPDHIANERERLEKQFKAYSKTLDDIKTHLEAAKNDCGEDRVLLTELRDLERDLNKEVSNSQNARSLYQRDLDHLDKETRELKQTLKEEKAKTNPYEKTLSDLQARRQRLKNDIENQAKNNDDLERAIQLDRYWIQGFKAVRLFVVEQALTQFEIEVNNNLIRLGLHGWRIEFDVERETKAGGVAKGFHAFVHSPVNPEPVPWEAWSGGETQRLRLAGTLGQASLMLNRKGIELDLEIWDEPSQYLSSEGVHDLVEALAERAVTLGKRVWLVDHRTLDHGGFERVYQVIKDKNGSRLEQLFVADGE